MPSKKPTVRHGSFITPYTPEQEQAAFALLETIANDPTNPLQIPVDIACRYLNFYEKTIADRE